METLKDKQKEAISNFVNGSDCFVILPTLTGRTVLNIFVERQIVTPGDVPPASLANDAAR